jgi:hypothetical protein
MSRPQSAKGPLTVRSGKGSKFRVLPLNRDARQAIDAYRDARPKVVDDRLFIGQRGHGISSRAVEMLVAKYAHLADLEDITPHTLRHSFGKHALDAGADLVSVSTLLGHQRLETTAIYTTPSQRDLEQVVEKLEQDGDLRGFSRCAAVALSRVENASLVYFPVACMHRATSRMAAKVSCRGRSCCDYITSTRKLDIWAMLL